MVLGRTVTIGMRCFGRRSVWKGGWFWMEVQGLVFIVEDVDVGELVRLRGLGRKSWSGF